MLFVIEMNTIWPVLHRFYRVFLSAVECSSFSLVLFFTHCDREKTWWWLHRERCHLFTIEKRKSTPWNTWTTLFILLNFNLHLNWTEQKRPTFFICWKTSRKKLNAMKNCYCYCCCFAALCVWLDKVKQCVKWDWWWFRFLSLQSSQYACSVIHTTNVLLSIRMYVFRVV